MQRQIYSYNHPRIIFSLSLSLLHTLSASYSLRDLKCSMQYFNMQNITSNNNTKITILILEKWNVYRVRLADSRKKHSREKEGEGGKNCKKGLLALFYRVRYRAATGLSGMRFETVVSRKTIEMIWSHSSEVTPMTIRGEFASLQIFLYLYIMQASYNRFSIVRHCAILFHLCYLNNVIYK